MGKRYIVWIEELGKEDLSLVGGKAANLGEMVRINLPVPPAFTITVHAYKDFLESSGLYKEIYRLLEGIDVDDTKKLHEISEKIQAMILKEEMPKDIENAIREAYRELCRREGEKVSVAVRSSATAEDLPTASFAGQQSSYLNVTNEDELIRSVQSCWASLFTPRAIFYREKHGFEHSKVLISVIVQRMVNADVAGVMFTSHPISGDKGKIVIESTWGLGESLVAGEITPDRFVLNKDNLEVLERRISNKSIMRTTDATSGKTVVLKTPEDKAKAQSLDDNLLKSLGKYGKIIEEHYGFPQDIEWAIERGKIYILQTRPITAFSKVELEGEVSEVLVRGSPASPGIASGLARIIMDVKQAYDFTKGSILVTRMTNPDWVPLMKESAGIVTDEGGITCHAAIVSRELGIPCVVGTGNATKVLKPYESKMITVDGSRGVVYSGVRQRIEQEERPREVAYFAQPITATKIYVNLSMPELAEKVAKETQPDGVGLLRAEHMMLRIGKHPRKLIEEGGEEKMINEFAEGIRKVAEAFYPKPVVYRFLDFKPDEFLNLEGGEIERELHHIGPNPMLGFRGAFRYRKEEDVFRLECRAVKKVREEYGLKNVWVMIPFVRTLEDLAETKKLMEQEGLKRGPDFKLWMMVEIPSNIFLIEEFIKLGIDGVSFGTNDLTMLILGVDRGDSSVAEIYDERDLSVLRALSYAIKVCKKYGVTTSICGQAPSVYPDYCEFLVRQGITSISVNPDAVVSTRRLVASIEQKILLEGILGKSEAKTTWDLR